jgi:hypothetical protein
MRGDGEVEYGYRYAMMDDTRRGDGPKCLDARVGLVGYDDLVMGSNRIIKRWPILFLSMRHERNGSYRPRRCDRLPINLILLGW